MSETKLQNMPTKHDGDGYVTLNGEVLQAFKVAKLNIKVETISTQKRFLNERVEQNAARGLKINGSISFYATSLALMKAIEAYKNGGEYPNIRVQAWSDIDNNDRREVLLSGVILSSLTMIDLDDTSDDEVISECDITANDYQIIQERRRYEKLRQLFKSTEERKR